MYTTEEEDAIIARNLAALSSGDSAGGVPPPPSPAPASSPAFDSGGGVGPSAATQSAPVSSEEANRQVGRMYAPGAVGPRVARGVGADPVMSVPKGRQDEAAKEFANYSTAQKSVSSVDSAFDRWRALPLTAGPWDRDREALQANILASYKSGLGPGMSSDKDAEKFLEPLMPRTGDSDATLKNKQELIASSIRSKVATPTLDTDVPGWRPPTDAEREAQTKRVQAELGSHRWTGGGSK